MALNLGTPAFEAIQRMKTNPEWRLFVTSLEDQMASLMHHAIECQMDTRIDNAGYARAIRDLLSLIRLAEKPDMPRNVKPRVKMREDIGSSLHQQTALNV